MSDRNRKSDSAGSESGSAAPQEENVQTNESVIVKVSTSGSANVETGSDMPQLTPVPARNTFRPISPQQVVREALSPELNNHLEGLIANGQTRGKLVDTMVALTRGAKTSHEVASRGRATPDRGISGFPPAPPMRGGTSHYGTFTDLWRKGCLLYTSPSPRDKRQSRMPSSA